MRELTHVLDLALEAIERLGVDLVGPHQLDRRRAAQQLVVRAVHGAVAALADLAVERVAAEAHRGVRLHAQAIDEARADRRERDHQPGHEDRAAEQRGPRKLGRRE
jgi:hypothetical protein